MRPHDRGPTVAEQVDIRAVSDLESLLTQLWPELFSGA